MEGVVPKALSRTTTSVVDRAILDVTGVDVNADESFEYAAAINLDMMAGIAIVLNAVHIGAQANCATRFDGPCMSAETASTVDAVFAVIFLIELAIRRKSVVWVPNLSSIFLYFCQLVTLSL